MSAQSTNVGPLGYKEKEASELTGLNIPAPVRKARAYDAEFVDGLLIEAQRAMDARAAKIADLQSILETAALVSTQDSARMAIAGEAVEILNRATVAAQNHLEESQKVAAKIITDAKDDSENFGKRFADERSRLKKECQQIVDFRDQVIIDIRGLLLAHDSALSSTAESFSEKDKEFLGRQPVEESENPQQPAVDATLENPSDDDDLDGLFSFEEEGGTLSKDDS